MAYAWDDASECRNLERAVSKDGTVGLAQGTHGLCPLLAVGPTDILNCHESY